MTTKKDETTMELLVDGKKIASAGDFRAISASVVETGMSPKEEKLTNKKFLERASKLQKEYVWLETNSEGLAGICSGYIHVRYEKFHEFEKENLLEHITKIYFEKDKYWQYEAMAPQGVKVIALEFVSEIEDKR